MPTYLRFVVGDIHEDSAKELGVFHAVRRLREEGKLPQHEEELHDVTHKWFNENLEKPTRFTASKPPFYRKPNKAISWFKDGAKDHLTHIRDLVAILENHGISVRLFRTWSIGRQRASRTRCQVRVFVLGTHACHTGSREFEPKSPNLACYALPLLSEICLRTVLRCTRVPARISFTRHELLKPVWLGE